LGLSIISAISAVMVDFTVVITVDFMVAIAETTL